MTKPVPSPIDLSLPRWRDDPQLLKAELLAQLADAVVIDAAVSRPVDTLTAQLLLSARRAASAAGTEFRIQNPSDPFCNGLRILGLHDDIIGEKVAQ